MFFNWLVNSSITFKLLVAGVIVIEAGKGFLGRLAAISPKPDKVLNSFRAAALVVSSAEIMFLFISKR